MNNQNRNGNSPNISQTNTSQPTHAPHASQTSHCISRGNLKIIINPEDGSLDYVSTFKLLGLGKDSNPDYPANDIGVANLFFALHSNEMCYIREAKAWYIYTGRRWMKDEGGLAVAEKCKMFAGAYAKYADIMDDGSDENKAYVKWAKGMTNRKRRESIISDAKSIAPKDPSLFDRDKLLLNCKNGTYNLRTMKLQQHSSADYITKLADVSFRHNEICKRWLQFVNEIMCGDAEVAKFLQKALGYALSGDTSLECFFILYGSTTRNGKSTLMETVGHILDDYARTAQPQTFARRSSDGASPSPDLARLRGARLVNSPEPGKGMELNSALIKQLTGGDSYTARNLNENPIEFRPEFKIFINTNHLPTAEDDTLFASGRVKLIPFNRHFSLQEQDNGLKSLFRKEKFKSGILNWLIEGYRLLQAEGLVAPAGVVKALKDYQQKESQYDAFCREALVEAVGNRLKTSEAYESYCSWARSNGIQPASDKAFMAQMRDRFFVKSDWKKGNCIFDQDLRRGGVGAGVAQSLPSVQDAQPLPQNTQPA